jgi:hypothetical protein
VRQLPVTASVVSSSPILVTLMKEALSSSETSVLRRATRHSIPEDASLHSHLRENLKSYKPSLFEITFTGHKLMPKSSFITGTYGNRVVMRVMGASDHSFLNIH